MEYLNRKTNTVSTDRSNQMVKIYFIACWMFWLLGDVFWEKVRRKINKILFKTQLDQVECFEFAIQTKPANACIKIPTFTFPDKHTWVNHCGFQPVQSNCHDYQKLHCWDPLHKPRMKTCWFYMASSSVWTTSHCLYLMNSNQNLFLCLKKLWSWILPTQSFSNNQEYFDFPKNKSNTTNFSNIEWNTNHECLYCRDIKSTMFTLKMIKSTMFVYNFCKDIFTCWKQSLRTKSDFWEMLELRIMVIFHNYQMYNICVQFLQISSPVEEITQNQPVI